MQGFRTRQGAQSHGEQTRKHVEEAAHDIQDGQTNPTGYRSCTAPILVKGTAVATP